MKYDDDMRDKTEKGIMEIRIAGYRARGFSERDAVVRGLADMKRTSRPEGPREVSSPAYSYDLSVSLDPEDLDKLGLTDVDLSANTRVCMYAKGYIRKVLTRIDADGHADRSAEIQITHMAVEPEPEPKPEA